MSRRVARSKVQTLLEEARALSSDFDILSGVVASKIGLNQSDLLAMDLIGRNAGVTAGLLAERLELTTGAITGLIDRLETAGFARRADDPEDRRRVLVVATAKEARISELYAPLATGLSKVAERYSDEQLALINGFIGELRALLEKSIESIRHSGRSYSQRK